MAFQSTTKSSINIKDRRCFCETTRRRNKNDIHELWYLQFSGILLLKREKDAEKVLEQVKYRGFPIDKTNFMKNKGILNGLKEAIDENIDLKSFRDVTIKQIGEAQETGDYKF